MTTAFVLGNGVSRQTVDLVQLQKMGTIYGCNALYRTFAPDVLVSTDTPISQTIQHSGYSQHNIHYTRRPINGLGALTIPQLYYGYSSGPVAVALAAEAAHRQIYLLGFDLGPDQNGSYNNMYMGTEFYKKPAAPPTYTGNWIQQIVDIINKFKSVMFVRVAGKTTAQIDKFDQLTNLSHMPLQDFVDRINNTKDF